VLAMADAYEVEVPVVWKGRGSGDGDSHRDPQRVLYAPSGPLIEAATRSPPVASGGASPKIHGAKTNSRPSGSGNVMASLSGQYWLLDASKLAGRI